MRVKYHPAHVKHNSLPAKRNRRENKITWSFNCTVKTLTLRVASRKTVIVIFHSTEIVQPIKKNVFFFFFKKNTEKKGKKRRRRGFVFRCCNEKELHRKWTSLCVRRLSTPKHAKSVPISLLAYPAHHMHVTDFEHLIQVYLFDASSPSKYCVTVCWYAFIYTNCLNQISSDGLGGLSSPRAESVIICGCVRSTDRACQHVSQTPTTGLRHPSFNHCRI